MTTVRSSSALSGITGDPGPFEPAWWCRNGHAQTIWAAVLRPTPSVPLRRERWETPDRDFLDVDQVVGMDRQPILVILHGLESSSESRQVRGLLHAAHRHGWHGLGVNFRSCSGAPNRLERSYHGGDTSDLAWVIQRLTAHYPQEPICCVGLSLGGNVLLKYLGEQAEAAPANLTAAVAISAPFDLAVSARAFEQDVWNQLYMRRLVRSLKRKTVTKLGRYPTLVDRRRLAAVRTIAEFDEAVTAPIHGFASAASYWAAASCGPFLDAIRRPTLLINAKDDLLVPARVLPMPSVAQNPFLVAEVPEAGGHVGFVSGPWPSRPVFWAEEKALAFCRRHVAAHERLSVQPPHPTVQHTS